MNIHNIFNRRNVILIIILVLLLLIASVGLDRGIFRLKSTNPPLDNIATSSVNIRFIFSQPIKSVDSVLIDGKKVTNISIDGYSVVIPVSALNFEDESDHSIEIHNIESQWFGSLIKKTERTLIVKYVDFDNLPKDQQKSQINNSSSGQVNDPFLNNIFPIIKEKYQIEASNSEDSEGVSLYITFFDEVPDYDNSGQAAQLPNNVAKKYREDVLKTIRDSGGSPDKYSITYSNIYLNDEFGSFRHSHD